MTKIKLCGITKEDDIHVINELLPDYIGFVFAGKSRRYISFDMAKKRLSDSAISFCPD